MKSEKPAQRTVQRPEEPTDLLSKNEKGPEEQRNEACKVYDPYNCPGHPACKECVNLLC